MPAATNLRKTDIESSAPHQGERRRPIRGLWAIGLIVLGLMVGPAAAARADAVWSGASGSSAWSDPTNWTGTPPSGSDLNPGQLSFPSLTGPCGTCYTNSNDVPGINATGLVFGNTSVQYQLQGDSLTVGAGGISDTPGGGMGDLVRTPLVLSSPQGWTLGGSNGYDSLTLLGGVTGPTSPQLTVSTPNGDLFVDSDMEVGPVISHGPGGLHIGGAPGLNRPGSINGSDGQPVTVDGGALIANLGSTSGPLTMTNSILLLGTNPQNNGTTSLQVSGTVTLYSDTTTETFINDNGPTPVTDFSQLNATSNITLGGQLVIGQGGQGSSNGPCVTLRPGDVATLVTTSGTLFGQYANAPEGATLPVGSCRQNPPAEVQIHYTPNSVTATVLGNGPPPQFQTTTTVGAWPSSPAVGSPVTYTAVVSQTGGPAAPTGTVGFSDNGSPIATCSQQALTPGIPSSTATCTVIYPNPGSHSITASYGGDSNFGASTSSAITVDVQPSGNSQGAPAVPAPALWATTLAATGITTTAANLGGTLSTGGQAASWQFEYGTSTNYNAATPLQTIAAGHNTSVPVSWTLKGLAPNTRYHYRLVATTQNSPGGPVATADGRDLTFTTRATGRLLLRARSLSVIGGAILVPQTCSSNLSCSGRFSVTTTAPVGKTHKLGTVLCATRLFRMRAHHRSLVRARITRGCLAQLRAKPRSRLAAKFTSRPRTGQLGVIRKITLTLR